MNCQWLQSGYKIGANWYDKMYWNKNLRTKKWFRANSHYISATLYRVTFIFSIFAFKFTFTLPYFFDFVQSFIQAYVNTAVTVIGKYVFQIHQVLRFDSYGSFGILSYIIFMHCTMRVITKMWERRTAVKVHPSKESQLKKFEWYPCLTSIIQCVQR